MGTISWRWAFVLAWCMSFPLALLISTLGAGLSFPIAVAVSGVASISLAVTFLVRSELGFIVVYMIGAMFVLKALGLHSEARAASDAPALPPPTRYASARERITEEYAAGIIDYQELESKMYTILANEQISERVTGSGDGI